MLKDQLGGTRKEGTPLARAEFGDKMKTEEREGFDVLNWLDRGLFKVGEGKFVVQNANFDDAESSWSAALTVISGAPTSELLGVPENVRDAELNWSHEGRVEVVYVREAFFDDWKVSSAMAQEYAVPTLEMSGSWQSIGFTSLTLPRTQTTASATRKRA
jgi:hypothetical protein